MPSRPTFASTFFALIAVASLLLPACSKSTPQDMHKGTDAAAGWTPPDSMTITLSYPDLAANHTLDTTAAPADVAASPDGGIVVDADIGEAN